MADSPLASVGPIVVAHRGWWRSTGLVENSARAFAMANSAGFAAECDTWPAADGEPVVIHDPTLDRTTLGRGEVSSYASDRLKTIRLREPEAFVPLLREVAGRVSYVEVKAPDSPAFVRRVIEIMGGRNWLLQSFDEQTLLHAAQMKPRLPVAFLVDEPGGFELALRREWSVHADYRILDARTVARFRERRLRIGAWTVNEKADIRRVLALGLDAIISDEPMLVRHLMVEAQLPDATSC